MSEYSRYFSTTEEVSIPEKLIERIRKPKKPTPQPDRLESKLEETVTAIEPTTRIENNIDDESLASGYIASILKEFVSTARQASSEDNRSITYQFSRKLTSSILRKPTNAVEYHLIEGLSIGVYLLLKKLDQKEEEK